MKKKYEIRLKILAIILLPKVIDLQTHIYIFSIFICILREYSMDLFQSKI